MKEPFKYQAEIIPRLAGSKRFGLFWDCGTGKTLTTLWALKQTGLGAFVVCPNSAQLAWDRDNKEVGIPIDYKNYTSFHKLTKSDVQGRAIVFDEAHALKDSDSDRGSKAIELLAYAPERLYLLTGTPIADKPLDMFNLLVLLGKRNPDEFYKYRGKYAILEEKRLWRWNPILKRREVYKRFKDVVGFRNLDKLREEGSSVSDYRKLSQCVDLPPATFIPYRYRLGPDARSEYKSMQGEHGQKLLQWAARASYTRVLELVEKIRKESGEKIVIFSNYIDVVKELSGMLEDSPYLVGGMSPEEIKQNVDRFYQDRDILLATYKTGGVSLDLQNASYCIMVDLPYYLLEYRQALGRLFRTGQTKKTFYYLMLPTGTVLEEVFELLDRKYNWTKKVFIEEENFDILRFLDEVRRAA